MKLLNTAYGWLFIRPLRWVSRKCMVGTCEIQWLPREAEYPIYGKYDWPNFHCVALEKTWGRFCHWLDDEAWQFFNKGKWKYHSELPALSRLCLWLAQTGYWHCITNHRCYHCNSDNCDVYSLAEDDSPHLEVTKQFTEYTPNGADHRTEGVTTCPKCGLKQEYDEGSL